MTTKQPEQQDHPLANGSTMRIYRNGNHQYWTDDDPIKRPSVTSLIAYVDGGAFGAGKGWAVREIRKHYLEQGEGGRPNFDIPDMLSAKARNEGNKLHSDIDKYIKTSGGHIAEENPAFLAWHRAMANTIYLDSEVFTYHPALNYGGTIDQVALVGDDIVVQDVKSVDPESWAKHGSQYRWAKDQTQTTAYIMALRQSGSRYKAVKGEIVYVLRDGSGVFTEEVHITTGMALFSSSRQIYDTLKLENKERSNNLKEEIGI